jgi:type VI secretion system protein ImpA
MENILDFEYILRPLEIAGSESEQDDFETARRNFGSERDVLFRVEQDIADFRLLGPPFEGASPPEPPEWSRYISDTQNHLAKNAKDLWVCVWLTEALLAYRGFAGLAEGFKLIRCICADHWATLQPPSTGEEGVGYTVKLLSAVSKRDAFIDAIRLAPITMESGQFMPASCATIAEIDDSERAALVGDTDDEFISELYHAVKECQQEWAQLEEILNEKCGEDKPPFAKVRESLTSCLNDVVTTFPQVIVEEEAETEETGLTVSESGNSVAGGGAMTGDNHLRNREQAFKTLEALSRYFSENEPSSPVSASLKQAIRWGRMSFADLLKDVVDDDQTREKILRLVGSRDEEEDSN